MKVLEVFEQFEGINNDIKSTVLYTKLQVAPASPAAP
jgi:hypothetical protein